MKLKNHNMLLLPPLKDKQDILTTYPLRVVICNTTSPPSSLLLALNKQQTGVDVKWNKSNNPSKIEWDLTNGPLSKLPELLY